MATTRPSDRTDENSSPARTASVRWVFPGSNLTRLWKRQIVGRDAVCTTVLEGTEISRQHAEFRVDGPVVAVRDLGSRNGVFVNGVSQIDARLDLGDVVRCGEWLGVVVAERDGADGFREIAPGWYGGAKLAEVANPAQRVAVASLGDERPTDIVVQGRTGTGKEGIARAIHLWSGRKGEFVGLNCAALPAQLAEAELFGYRKGAFTGADTASPGLFRAANGGTLFLDEILELPAPVQAKLLRVLQEHEVRGVGETRDVAIDVRVIAATQEPLMKAVDAGRFRADLQARLEGFTVILPPLAERREDIVPLFLGFLDRLSKGRPPAVEPKLLETLCVYDWPTNVRELQHLARSLLALHGSEPLLRKSFLPAHLLSGPAVTPRSGAAVPRPAKRTWRKTDDSDEFEKLRAALGVYGGSVGKAAGAIGVSRARAYRLLAAHPEFSIDGVGD